VHRTVAPILRDMIKPWLRFVTDSRYTEVRVDPESLGVTVSSDGRKWPKAEHLSHGTAEQIYVLLRIAMARHLTSKGEICPMILDDVTVNCDLERQNRILDLLHKISDEQQVIVFSQESETLDWAEQNISKSRDLLVKLAPSRIPA
jgi:exonuclease SbcC